MILYSLCQRWKNSLHEWIRRALIAPEKNNLCEAFVSCYSVSHLLLIDNSKTIHSRVDTDVLMEVAYSCNFLAVSDSSTCPDIGTN